MIAPSPYIDSPMLFYLILATTTLTQLVTMLVAPPPMFVWLVVLFVIGIPIRLFQGVVCAWFLAGSCPYRT